MIGPEVMIGGARSVQRIAYANPALTTLTLTTLTLTTFAALTLTLTTAHRRPQVHVTQRIIVECMIRPTLSV